MVWKFTFLSDSLFWALFFENPTFKSTFLSTFLWVQLFWVLFWVLFWERYFFEYFFEDSKKCIYFFEYFLEWVSFFEPLKKVVLLFWVLFWALFFYFSELATFMGYWGRFPLSGSYHLPSCPATYHLQMIYPIFDLILSCLVLSF